MQKVYNNFYRTVANNLAEFLAYCPKMQLGAISEDMKHIGWSYVEFKNNYNTNEIIKPFEIFFINGRFPSDENLGPIAAGNIPAFIKTETPISPLRLHEKFRNTPAHDLVCT